MTMTAEELQDYRDSLSILSAPELQAQLGEDPEMDKIIQSLLDAGKAVDLKSGANIGADDGEADDPAPAAKKPGADGNTEDDDDDDDDDVQTFVDEHGRPVPDPNGPEAQAAAEAAAATAAANDTPAPAPAPAAVAPLDLSFLDAEHKEKLAALDATKAAQFKKLMEGEIEPEEYSKAESEWLNAREAASADKQASAAWFTQIHNFKAGAVASGVDYFNNQSHLDSLDAWVKRLAENPAHADKEPGWFLEQAHKKVLIEHEITAPAPAAPAKPVADAKKVAKPNGRAPNLQAIPPTLGALPAATTVDAGDGGEFAHLDNLTGMAFERAIAAMTPEQRDRWAAQ